MAGSGGGVGNLAGCKRVAWGWGKRAEELEPGPRVEPGDCLEMDFPVRAASGQKAKEAFTSPRRS